MPSKGVYFDLAVVRRMSASLDTAFLEAKVPYQMYIGKSSKSKEALVLAATGGGTTAVWCLDDTIFDGRNNFPLSPTTKGLFSEGVFGKDAYFKDTGSHCRLHVDKTIAANLGGDVFCDIPYDKNKRISFSIPDGTHQSAKLYSTKITEAKDIVAFLSGIGMMYGFGSNPGFNIKGGKLSGLTSGDKPGMFEIPANPTENIVDSSFFAVPKEFCYVALNLFGSMDLYTNPKDVSFGIFNEGARGKLVVLRCGECIVYSELTTPSTAALDWEDNMPIAIVGNSTLNKTSVFVMLSALSTMIEESGDKSTTAVLACQHGQGLVGKLKNGSQVTCSEDMEGFPEFEIELNNIQVMALSNAVAASLASSAETDSKTLEVLLGEDDEIMISVGEADRWMIRLR